MSVDDRVVEAWRRQHRREEFLNAHLPRPLRRLLARIYNVRPSAVTFRRGVADRNRVSALVSARCRAAVRRGPFAGMAFPHLRPDSASKCMGSYERELHDEIERIIARAYPTVLNVGCADGYYAVGLARRMSRSKILAYDIDRHARALCRDLAEANELGPDRISVRSEMTYETLAELCQRGTLIIADIEGAERELLDPARVPQLADVDMLVELHDFLIPGTEDRLRRRFAESHFARAIDSEPRDNPMEYPELNGLSNDDQMLALFERPVAMRWLILETRNDRRRPS